jgi:hypothetical protein
MPFAWKKWGKYRNSCPAIFLSVRGCLHILAKWPSRGPLVTISRGGSRVYETENRALPNGRVHGAEGAGSRNCINRIASAISYVEPSSQNLFHDCKWIRVVNTDTHHQAPCTPRLPTPPCFLARDLYARHTRACCRTQHPLQPAALALMPYGFVLVRVRFRSSSLKFSS